MEKGGGLILPAEELTGRIQEKKRDKKIKVMRLSFTFITSLNIQGLYIRAEEIRTGVKLFSE